MVAAPLQAFLSLLFYADLRENSMGERFAYKPCHLLPSVTERDLDTASSF